MMKAGTTEEHLNVQGRAMEGENESEKRKPTAHSLQDTHFLSGTLCQCPGGRGSGPHTHSPHYVGIEARGISIEKET